MSFDVEAFFGILSSRTPNPRTELQYKNPYTLLVAVVLSAQSTDKGVNKATKALFKHVQTPEDMLHLGEKELIQYIKTLGLYRHKARYILGLSKILVEEFHSTLPNKRSDLERLPGVGRKTANVILNVVFGHPTMAVDTHIFRVSNRTGLAKGKTPLAVEQGLLKHLAHLPLSVQKHAHHWLVLHGRYTCTARNPACKQCPVFNHCQWHNKIL